MDFELAARVVAVVRDMARGLPTDRPMDDVTKITGGLILGLILADRHPEGVGKALEALIGGEEPMPGRMAEFLGEASDYIFFGEEVPVDG